MFLHAFSVFDRDLSVIYTPNGKTAEPGYYRRAAKAKERICSSVRSLGRANLHIWKLASPNDSSYANLKFKYNITTLQGSHFSCFCIVCEATSPQAKASPQSLTVSHRVFTAMFVLHAAIAPSGETTQNKTGDISITEHVHTTQIYGRQQFTNVLSF